MARASCSLPGSVPMASSCPRWRLAPPASARSARRSISASRSATLGLFLLGQLVLEVGGLVRAPRGRAAPLGLLLLGGAPGLDVRALAEQRAQLLGRGLFGSHVPRSMPRRPSGCWAAARGYGRARDAGRGS